MKFASTTVLLAAFCSTVGAQETGPKPAPAAASPAPAAATAAPAINEESVKQAESLLKEVSTTYKNAKALTDTIEMKMETPMGNQAQEMKVVIGSGDDAVLSFSGMSLIAVNGKLNFVREDVKDKYFGAPWEGGLGKTLQSIFGEGFPPPPQFVLRTDASLEEKL